jgi:hypothetical protein
MYRITRALSVGRFPTPERAADLLAAGVTHVLNVSGGPSVLAAAEGSFREVAWVPLTDFGRVPEPLAVRALDTLHRMAGEPGSHVYVHCVFGQNRSPTVLWLYLVACGLPPEEARELIQSRSPDAIAGHPRLVTPELVRHVMTHGLVRYQPTLRPEVVAPFEPEQTSPG